MLASRGRLSLLLLAISFLALASVAPAAGGAVTNGTADSVPGLPTDSSTAADVETGDNLTIVTAEGDVADAVGAQTATATIDMAQDLRLVTAQKGIYEVLHEYEMPPEASLYEVTLPESASVRSADGFLKQDPQTWEWDGTTTNPTLRYRLPGNRSIDQTGPIAGPGRFLYVDVGEWALVSQPQVGHRWGYASNTPVDLAESVSARNGVTGDVIAYLGDYRQYTRDAHGQTFRLVVPEPASLGEDRNALFDALATASDRLRVGDRDESVLMIAAPTGDVDWGVRGLATGQSDLWVRDFERLDDPTNVWIHEYTHTRQDFTTADDLEWTTEGIATYYAALLALERGDISFSEFKNYLEVGRQNRYSSSVLDTPESWESGANYRVGSFVGAALDRLIRSGPDSHTSFDEVFHRINAHQGVVTGSDFLDAVRAVSNTTVENAAERWTTSTRRPDTWTEQQYQDAFDQDPARITFALQTGENSHQVSGAYRNRSLGPVEPSILVPGETLTLGITATNHGGTTGDFIATLRENDQILETREGTLEPGESRELTFDRTFESVGQYIISVGTARVSVSVREPADVIVGSATVDRGELAVGDTVNVTFEIENPAPYPAERTLTLTRNGETIDSRRVTMDAASSRTEEFAVEMSDAGTFLFALEGTTSVIVGPDTNGDSEDTGDGQTGDTEDGATDDEDAADGGADDGGSGFGILVAIAVLVLAGVYGVVRVRVTGGPGSVQ